MFAYSISHDLRTPIRQIDGFVALMREHLQQVGQPATQQSGQANKLDSKTQHYLSVILDLTAQSGTMINALLDFSKTGRVEMRLGPVDMDRMVRQMSLDIGKDRGGHQEEHQAIEWRIEALPTVVCDRTLIRQVWQNLLENAVKFTHQQKKPIITIQARTQAKDVVFSVEDNGIGFEPKQSESIFDMFQRAHSQRTAEGFGIGLANVKRIIARHGGQVWAKGRVDKGAALFFFLTLFIKNLNEKLKHTLKTARIYNTNIKTPYASFW